MVLAAVRTAAGKAGRRRREFPRPERTTATSRKERGAARSTTVRASVLDVVLVRRENPARKPIPERAFVIGGEIELGSGFMPSRRQRLDS